MRKSVLHYSGGIDSLACLFKLRDEWDSLTVMWCNTGAAYPSTVEHMQTIAKLGPKFEIITSNQPDNIARLGFPVDLVPVDATVIGHQLSGEPGVVFQSRYECCARNIWGPLMRATLEGGYQRVYRGQRLNDTRRAPFRSGFVDEFGIEYVLPIEDWTRERVFQFCEEACPELIPVSYDEGEKTGRDCWDCTAYLFDNERRIENLPEPQRAIVMRRLSALEACSRNDINILHRVIG